MSPDWSTHKTGDHIQINDMYFTVTYTDSDSFFMTPYHLPKWKRKQLKRRSRNKYKSSRLFTSIHRDNNIYCSCFNCTFVYNYNKKEKENILPELQDFLKASNNYNPDRIDLLEKRIYRG